MLRASNTIVLSSTTTTIRDDNHQFRIGPFLQSTTALLVSASEVLRMADLSPSAAFVPPAAGDRQLSSSLLRPDQPATRRRAGREAATGCKRSRNGMQRGRNGMQRGRNGVQRGRNGVQRGEGGFKAE